MTVVLDKKGITMFLDGKSLCINCPETPLQRVPLGMVGQVIVYGNPIVGCNVWRKLSENGIPALFLPARGFGEPSWTSPGFSTSIMVRINQYQAWMDNKIRTKAVIWLLKRKIKGFLNLANILKISGTFLNDCILKLDKTENIESLRGIEGAAAKEWFSLFAGVLPDVWGFSGRNRQPPKDPVNALLSLGYTLLVSEIRQQVHQRGLDPCLGFLHAPYSGRESLVLDIAEPLRSGIDAFVLGLVKEELTPDDFTFGKKDGCRMSKQGRSLFYPAWEEWKNNWSFPVFMENHTNTSQKLRFVSKTLVDEFVRFWNIPEYNTEK